MDELNSYKNKNALEMFDRLRDNVGKEISYSAWLYGVKMEGTDILKEVNDFANIETEKYSMPFIGYGTAIYQIISKDGELLYYNPYVKRGYDERSMPEISFAIMRMFGDTVYDRVDEKPIVKKRSSKKSTNIC